MPRTIQSAWNLVEGAWPNSTGLYTLMTMEQQTENMGGGNSQNCPELTTAQENLKRGAQFQNFYNS